MSLSNWRLLKIRQTGQIVGQLIVNKGTALVDYLFRDNEVELSNCFSINQEVRQNFV